MDELAPERCLRIHGPRGGFQNRFSSSMQWIACRPNASQQAKDAILLKRRSAVNARALTLRLASEALAASQSRTVFAMRRAVGGRTNAGNSGGFRPSRGALQSRGADPADAHKTGRNLVYRRGANSLLGCSRPTTPMTGGLFSKNRFVRIRLRGNAVDRIRPIARFGKPNLENQICGQSFHESPRD